MVGRIIASGVSTDAADQRAGAARRCALAGRAQPGRAFGRHRKLPRRRRIPDPGRGGTLGQRHHRVQEATASAWRSRRPCSATALINLKIEPEVSQIDTTIRCSSHGISIPALIVRRAITTVELRDGQSFVIAGLLQSISTDRPEAVALARRRAGARRAVPQRLVPEERDRPRHHRDAAPGAPGASRRRAAARRSTTRCRRMTPTSSCSARPRSRVPMARRIKWRRRARSRSVTSSICRRESPMSSRHVTSAAAVAGAASLHCSAAAPTSTSTAATPISSAPATPPATNR